jgi:hypothetical protein
MRRGLALAGPRLVVLTPSSTSTAPAIGTFNVQPGAIVIQPQPGEDSDLVARKVLTGLRSIARQQSGNTLDLWLT